MLLLIIFLQAYVHLSDALLPAFAVNKRHCFGARMEPRTSSTVVAFGVESEEELEWDEDEFEPSLSSVGEYIQKLERLSTITSTDATAIDQATALFDELYKAYLTTEDSSLWPTTTVYNRLIEVYAYSGNTEGAEQAATILDRLQNNQSEVTLPRPNRETFALVMVAWMRRGRLDKVEELLQDMLASSDESLRPNIYVYNKVIQARGMAGKPNLAEELLEQLIAEGGADEDDDDTEDEVNNPSTFPNHKSWVQVMRAYANPPFARKNGVEKIEELMGKMAQGFRVEGHEDWSPRSDAYDALLSALSHTKGSAREAERILYEMMERCQNGDKTVCPTENSFYHVCRAYQDEGGSGTAFKVEKLLQLQDALAIEDESLRPSPKVLSAAMMAMSRADDSTKAMKADKLLQRIRRLHEETGTRPKLFPFKSLLNACAYTESDSPDDKMKAFQLAVTTLNEIRDSPDLDANSSIYGLFLRACGNLMPSTKKRDDVVENIFRICCKEGLVNDYVLSEFRRAASKGLQLKILSGFIEDGVELPREWSRQVQT